MTRHSLIFQLLVHVCSDSLHLDPLPQGLFYQDNATPLLLYRAAKVRMTTSDSPHSTHLGAEVCTQLCVLCKLGAASHYGHKKHEKIFTHITSSPYDHQFYAIEFLCYFTSVTKKHNPEYQMLTHEWERASMWGRDHTLLAFTRIYPTPPELSAPPNLQCF